MDRLNLASERLGRTTTGFVGGGLGPHVGAVVSSPRCLDVFAFRSDCAVVGVLSLYTLIDVIDCCDRFRFFDDHHTDECCDDSEI